MDLRFLFRCLVRKGCDAKGRCLECFRILEAPPGLLSRADVERVPFRRPFNATGNSLAIFSSDSASTCLSTVLIRVWDPCVPCRAISFLAASSPTEGGPGVPVREAAAVWLPKPCEILGPAVSLIFASVSSKADSKLAPNWTIHRTAISIRKVSKMVTKQNNSGSL